MHCEPAGDREDTDTGTDTWPRTGSVLFVGAAETHETPYTFAKTLLADSEKGAALFAAGSHPDFKVIVPEKTRIIKIDQIRHLNEWAQQKPSIATRKIALLHPVDALNIQAGNALLKTLEEPSPTTLFILITAHPKRILPTITSRCHIIRYRTRDRLSLPPDSIRSTLQQEVLQDLKALKEGTLGPLPLAEAWSKKAVDQMLYWVVVHFYEQVREKALEQENVIRDKTWWALLDHVQEAKRMLEDKTPVNLLLLLETLFIHFTRVYTH